MTEAAISRPRKIVCKLSCTARRTVCGVMPCFSLYSICLARRYSDIEISRAQHTQNFDALYRVDVAVEIAHLQSDISQIICQIFGCSFRQRCHENSLVPFDTLTAELDCVVDLML